MKRSTKLRNRTFSFLMAIVMVMMLIIPASATDVQPADVTGSTPIDESILEVIEEEDLTISEEEASYIAAFFVQDMVATEQTSWNDSTTFIDTVPMYDETGINVTGYTVRLTSGYVVVSAYLDIPSLILEWSDVEDPLYEMCDISDDDKVIYTGALDYYIDDGTETLETIEGEEITRNEVSNDFEEQRDIENVDEEVLLAIIEQKQAESEPTGITTFSNKPGEAITDPAAYAKYVYGGTFSAVNWSNHWENYTSDAIWKDFSSYPGPCGPIAITNIVKMYGNKYNNSSIKSSSKFNVFDKIMEVNKESGYKFYNNIDGGTPQNTTGTFIKNTFKKYNVNVSTYGQYKVDYQNTVNALGPNSSNRLMYIITYSDPQKHPYGNHAIVGYAYNRLANSNGVYRAFIKVKDGWTNDPRYVEIDSIAANNAHYWEVYF